MFARRLLQRPGRGPLLVAVVAASLVYAQEPASLEVFHYGAEIEPNFDTGAIQGTVSMSIRVLDAAVRELVLDSGDLHIRDVSASGSPLAYEREGSRLHIDLGTTRAGSVREIRIDYDGRPTRGIRFSRELRQFSTVFATSHWMPSLDTPRARATLDLSLIVPDDVAVVGSGALASERPLSDGRIMSRWLLRAPMPGYTYGFAAGPLREVTEFRGATALRFLASSDYSESDIRQVFEDTADMLSFFAEKAGVAYPSPSYTQVLLHDASAQEMSGFAVFDETYADAVLGDTTAIWLGAHEAAHQWWGNSVTNRSWGHFWLNEGMASFMAAAYLEHRLGCEVYLNSIGEMRARYDEIVSRGHDKSLVFRSWESPSADDRSLVYNKGAYVLHLLREELGDEAFWRALRDYTQRCWLNSVTTEQFQRAFELASDRDLSEFFGRWVYSSLN